MPSVDDGGRAANSDSDRLMVALADDCASAADADDGAAGDVQNDCVDAFVDAIALATYPNG